MIIYVLFLIVAVAYFWRIGSYIISAATPEFLIIMLIGSILCLVTIFFWTLSVPNNIVTFCYLRLIFPSLGFILLFGALIIKTWRISLLISEQSMRVYSISTFKIILLLVILIAIDTVFLVIILGGSQFETYIVSPEPYRPYYDYYDCKFYQNEDMGTVVTWILIAFKGILIITGVIYSILIRKVKYLHLNESKWIGYSMYNLFITFIPVVIVQVVQEISNEAKFVVRSVFIIFIILSTTLLIFLSKFYYKLRGKDTKQRIKHSSTKVTSSNTGSNLETSKETMKSSKKN